MHKTVQFFVSTQADGSMSKAVSDDERLRNQRRFLAQYGLSPEQVVLVHLTYGGSNYRRYSTIHSSHAGDGIIRPSTIAVDALFTKDGNVALLLPIADCIATVLYDKVNQILGLAHLGRHNLLQRGGEGVLEYMHTEFGTDPSNVEVWLSPAAGESNYPLFDFDNKSLHEVAQKQLVAAGVLPINIAVDSRDTTVDETLFSHSEFLKGKRPTDGRQAVVCMMKV